MAGCQRDVRIFSPGVRVLLDSMRDLPAVVFNSRLDIVATNALGRALYVGPGSASAQTLGLLDSWSATSVPDPAR